MKKLITIFILFVYLPISQFGCKESETPDVPVYVQLQHYVDSEQLEFDSIRYVNEAGNHYSTTRLLYYLSGFSFTKEDGSKVSTANAYYVDAHNPATLHPLIVNLPEGNYSSLSFNIGLIPELNVFGKLSNTTENAAMFWPEQMGGGYHFMKFEGHFIDNSSAPIGFAMHLGTNKTLISVQLNKSFSINPEHNTLTLRMNIQEWFRNPITYDLNDGYYSMGDSTLMKTLKMNGQDVFTLIQ